MNPYIVFNGLSNEDIGPDGLIIEQLPDELKPARKFEESEVYGRDGNTIQDLGGYDGYQTSMKINCNGASISDVYAWLDGEGWLTTSDDPKYMRYVGFYEQFKADRFRAGACYDTITVPIRVQPFKYLVEQTPIYVTEPTEFSGDGNRNAKPLLEITGNGNLNLMINGSSVLIDDLAGTIYLDCDTETPYTVDANGTKVFAGRKITVVDDEWPQLKPDANGVNWSGSISQVIVHPWWRWI